MPWTGAALAAYEATFLATDKPIIIGENAADFVTAIGWRTGLLGKFSDTDVTDSQAVAILAADRYGHARTKPSSAGTQFSFLMTVSPNSLQDVDCMHFWEHNFGDFGPTTVISQVADSADFTTGLRTLATKVIASGDNHRFSMMSLNSGSFNPARISDGPYWRITIDMSSSGIPELGDWWLSRRRQLRHHAVLPFDDLALVDGISRNMDGGVIFDYPDFTDKADKNFVLDSVENVERDDLKAWWAGRRGGKAFIWMELPNSEPNNFEVMKLKDNRRAGELQVNTWRIWRIPMIEQHPPLELD